MAEDGFGLNDPFDDVGRPSADQMRQAFDPTPAEEPSGGEPPAAPEETAPGTAPATQQPEPTSPPAAPPASEPVDPIASRQLPEPPAEPAAPETAEPPAERKFADKFLSVEDLEKGYRELTTLRLSDRSEGQRLAEEVAQQREALRQVAAYLQQQQAAQTPAIPPISPELARAAEERGIAPEQLPVIQAMAAEIANQQVAQVRGEMAQWQQGNAQQAQAATEQQAQVEAMRGFLGKHPEVDQPTFTRIASTFDDLGLDAFPVQEWAMLIELAADAAHDEHLYQVLRAYPDLPETDEGIQEAYYRAQERAARAGAPTNGSTPRAGLGACRRSSSSTRTCKPAQRGRHGPPGCTCRRPRGIGRHRSTGLEHGRSTSGALGSRARPHPGRPQGLPDLRRVETTRSAGTMFLDSGI